MKRRLDLALLIGGAVVLAVLALGRDTVTASGAARSTYSTYDTGPNGYRAFYETLRRAGVPVRRFERALPLLDSDVRTLVLAAYEDDPAAKPLAREDAEDLARFVDAGGRLVVLDGDFAGKRDFTPGVGSSHPATAAGALALVRGRYTAGVDRVRAPIEAVFGFERWPGATPLLANDRGVVAVAYRHNKGEVVAITAPALFGNAHLLDEDNLSFAYDAVSGHGAVAFDEYVHGYDRDETFWHALPPAVHAATWVVAAIVVLALIGANVPFAPPIPLEAPDARDTTAFVDAMASLMRRARAGAAVTGAFAADAARRSRGRRATPADVEELAELDRLARAAPSDANLVRAAIIDHRFRKESS